MKKKILIFSHAMEIGGAERALIGLLESFDYDKFDVDLFLMRHVGELMELIPKKVNLLEQSDDYACLAVPIADIIKKGKLKIAYGRLLGKFKAKRFNETHKLTSDSSVALDYSHKYTKKYMSKISDTEYDLAISFLTPHYFVTEKVNAQKKIAWIHTDYSTVSVDIESEKAMWGRYDKIVSISESCKKSFLSKFPELSDKMIDVENILSDTIVLKQSDEIDVSDEMPNDGSVKLLSVGRFSHAKNFDNVPEICSLILKTGINIKWYLIGYGGDEALIRSKISEFGMENNVIILGKKTNPYPYIKACDLYVQPSRYEGKAVTVREAQILGKPVVITRYATSSSQLCDGVDGVIVPTDNAGCAEGIAALLNNRQFMMELSENCKARDYSNRDEIEKLYRVM